MTITKEMTIEQVIALEPRTINVFLKYGMHCIGCHAATWETIQETAFTHGIEDLEGMLNELNQACAKKS
jgi:hybrid cluster-associated redox disulfide protein